MYDAMINRVGDDVGGVSKFKIKYFIKVPTIIVMIIIIIILLYYNIVGCNINLSADLVTIMFVSI